MQTKNTNHKVVHLRLEPFFFQFTSIPGEITKQTTVGQKAERNKTNTKEEEKTNESNSFTH